MLPTLPDTPPTFAVTAIEIGSGSIERVIVSTPLTFEAAKNRKNYINSTKTGKNKKFIHARIIPSGSSTLRDSEPRIAGTENFITLPADKEELNKSESKKSSSGRDYGPNLSVPND